MSGYRDVINKIAMSQVATAPNIPDFHLMVGSAECLDGLAILVYKNASVPNTVVQNMQNISDLSNDEIAKKIADGSLEVNDINLNLATLGGGI